MDFRAFRLTAAEREELLAAQDECTVTWTNEEGWPVGVVQTYVWHDGAFWVTSFRDKPRVARLQADPRAAVIVSSKGTPVGSERMVSARASATVHDDAASKDWFYPAFAARVVDDETALPSFVKILGRQDRVIIELRPLSWTTFDGMLLRRGGRST
jgi:general stress protein 26